MPQILTTGDTMMCQHGGTVSLAPGQTRVSAGAYVIRPGDISIVVGCLFAPGGGAHPCLTVDWQNPSPRVSAAGANVLTRSSIGLCKAGDQAVQGTVLILQTQQRATAQ